MSETMTITTAAPAPAAAAQAPAPAPAAPAAAPAPAPAVATDINAAAPAPAPAAAPAPAPAPAADAKPGVVSYEPTGDPGMDLALGFLGKLGFGLDHPAMAAAEAGNFALLKAELALKGDAAKGWEQIVALGEQSFATIKAKADAAQQKQTDAILSAFGDTSTPEAKAEAAKQWDTVREWAKTNAEPDERAAVNAAIAAGGIAAKAMAAYLNGLYRAHPSAVIEPASVTNIGGRPSTDQSGALSPSDYKIALGALRAKLGQAMDGSPEYKALQARRLAFRG